MISISNNMIVISIFFNVIFICYTRSVDQEYNTGRIPGHVRRRQDTVPVIYVNGSHYEVGYMIGKTFGSIIRDFVEEYKPLKDYLDIYETSEIGNEIYQECLETTDIYFPQYLVELKGIADGSGVPFHKLFLIHLNDIIMSNALGNAYGSDTGRSSAAAAGCSTLIVNIPSKGQFIGHNEDANNVVINRFYIVSAHIYPRLEECGGVFEAREEKWEAMTYAGMLSGQASGHNYHGLAFTVNSVFSEKPFENKIPGAFLTRALLASKSDLNEIQETLTNRGAGTADAFRVNVGFVEDSRYSRVLYSIEVTPSETSSFSHVFVQPLTSGATSFYTNRLQYSECDKMKKTSWKSSNARQKIFMEAAFSKPIESLDDLLKILGAAEDGDWQIFKDCNDDSVNTINLGVFDFITKTWSVWTNNPRKNTPVIELPLKFTTRIRPDSENRTVEKRPYFTRFMSDVSSMYSLGRKSLSDLID